MACPHAFGRVAALAVVAVLVAPVAHADESLVLFAHYNAPDLRYWMTAADRDANATSIYAGYNPLITAAFAVEMAEGEGGDNAPLAATWVMPLEPALNQTIQLDSSRPVAFHLFLSPRTATAQGNPIPGAADWTVLSRLRQGEQTVAEASVEVQLGPTTEFTHVPLEAVLDASQLDPANGTVEWLVRATGPSTSYLLGLNASVGHSNISIPLAPPPQPSNSTATAPASANSTRTETVTQTTSTTRTVTTTTTVTQDAVVVHTGTPAPSTQAPGAPMVWLVIALAVAVVGLRQRL